MGFRTLFEPSSDAVAFGAAKRPSHPLRQTVTEVFRPYIFLKDIPTLGFGIQYTQPDEIARSFGHDRPAILIENDGFIVTGDELLETFDRLEVAEFSARSLVMGHSLGELVPINEEQVAELRERFS